MRWAGLLAIALLAGACGAGDGAVSLQLSWRFADDRRCPEAGVARVGVTVERGSAVKEENASLPFACGEGQDGGAVRVDDLRSSGAHLWIDAFSPAGAALYRGELRLGDPLPPAVTATLLYTGGE